MAKITVEFDTMSKEVAVMMDGTKLDNVCYVEVSPSWEEKDEMQISVVTRMEDEASDVTTMTRLMASKQENVPLPANLKAKAGTVVVDKVFEETKLTPVQSIATLFGV